jgi:hypothetical protein
MVRALSVSLAVGTMRALLVPFFAIYGHPSDRIIGVCMWLGFLINVGFAEWALKSKTSEATRFAAPSRA